VEFSVSDHQGVSVPQRPLLQWEAGSWAWQVPGFCGWKEARGSTEFSPFSCQVITRKVNIQVGDVNDNAPTFHNQPYSVRIPEVGVQRHPVGSLLLLISAWWGMLRLASDWASPALSSPYPAQCPLWAQ
jgi:hypothetical protein